MAQETLIRLAKTILDFNWAGGYTRPGPRLYPHQWSWDSALIAIGYARYDQDRATKELEHLLESQWKNGLLPHEVKDPRLTGESSGGLECWRGADHIGSDHRPAPRVGRRHVLRASRLLTVSLRNLYECPGRICPPYDKLARGTQTCGC